MKGRLALFLVVGLILSSATYIANSSKYFEITKNLEIFTNLYKEVNLNYVDELDPGKLMRTAIDAMLESLDPYTNYISESQVEDFRLLALGSYNGIGATVRFVDGYTVIDEAYEGSPVIVAGLKSGDQIVEVDGRSTEGRTLAEVQEILRGAAGTDVHLKVKRPTSGEEIQASLTREEVKVPNVPFSGMVDNGIGYITLTTFTQHAGRNVLNAFRALKAQSDPRLEGVILDLRGNGGGLLSEAVNICNIFIEKGEEVVTTKGSVPERDRTFKTQNAPEDLDIPIVVLIDNGSASASEIVSGTLQDLDRAIVLGQRSYGKGLVQNTKEVGYNSTVRITIAKYYIPSGRCIQAVEYENGEPKDIPDSLRAKFYTKSGRTVLDGGGIVPDIELNAIAHPELLRQLQAKNLIFKYVTEYVTLHPSIGPVEQFAFSDYEGFLSFVRSSGFVYDDPWLKKIKTLQADLSSADLEGIGSDLISIQKKVQAYSDKAFETHRASITDAIAKEIISRNYFHSGKYQYSLQKDPEIARAVSVLKDNAEYRSILKK